MLFLDLMVNIENKEFQTAVYSNDTNMAIILNYPKWVLSSLIKNDASIIKLIDGGFLSY